MELIKRRFVIGAAGLAVLGGGGAAVAVAQDSGGEKEREALLNSAAKRLNVSPDELKDALQGAFFERLDQAVKDGRLTEAQADRIKERVREDGGLPLGPGPGFHVRHHGGPLLREGFDAAAKYLGLSRAELREQLRDENASLADVARERNKSVDGLKDAISDAVRAELDEAVKDERLTDRRRDRIVEDLDERIDDIVNREGPRPGRHGRGSRGGPPFGPPPGP